MKTNLRPGGGDTGQHRHPESESRAGPRIPRSRRARNRAAFAPRARMGALEPGSFESSGLLRVLHSPSSTLLLRFLPPLSLLGAEGPGRGRGSGCPQDRCVGVAERKDAGGEQRRRERAAEPGGGSERRREVQSAGRRRLRGAGGRRHRTGYRVGAAGEAREQLAGEGSAEAAERGRCLKVKTENKKKTAG